MKKTYSRKAIMPRTWRNKMDPKIIDPATGKPIGAGQRIVTPGGQPQQMRPGPQPGGPPPGGPGPMPGAVPPAQPSGDQIEQMFKAYQQTKMQSLFNDINEVIAKHQCDFAITCGALAILQNVYATRATSPPQQQPMGPPPPEMTATGTNTPPPDPAEKEDPPEPETA